MKIYTVKQYLDGTENPCVGGSIPPQPPVHMRPSALFGFWGVSTFWVGFLQFPLATFGRFRDRCLCRWSPTVRQRSPCPTDTDNSPMRIDLKVPYAEKDAAKALGARWDPAKKIWYVKDVADFTPFTRWIPDLKAVIEGSSSGATPQSAKTGKVPTTQSAGVITGPAVVAPHCGCNVQPWEHCEHTLGQ